MLLYNVTISINKSHEADWVQWMKENHIPKVLNTGMFTGHQFYIVLSHDDPVWAESVGMLVSRYPGRRESHPSTRTP